MNLLLVHANSLDQLGGAELSFSAHLRAAPEGVRVDVVLPADQVHLEDYDTVILANLRPVGGLGELAEYRWARLWARRLKGYDGYVIKSERDVHPCAHRDGRCIQTEPLQFRGCDCSPSITTAFETLYNLCDAIQFLSPLHRAAINQLVRIRGPRQYTVASPIDLEHFRVVTPFHKRKHAALLTGDAVRRAPEAVALAEAQGYPVEEFKYLSVAYDHMPELLNQYQAVVIAPVMLHGFGRLAVEALACGCRIITNNRVGALSWEDPLDAGLRANDMFWAMVADRPARPNPRRRNPLAFWR